MIKNHDDFVRAYPNLDRHVHTGGNCYAWQLPIGKGFALITCIDDPSPPLPQDDKIAIGFYEYAADGDWLLIDDETHVVTWEEAEKLLDKAMNIPPDWSR